jgi:predicted phosphodiesterase
MISKRRVILGLLAWSAALVLAMLWRTGSDVWPDRLEPLTTDVDEVRIEPRRPARIAVIGDIQNGLSELAAVLELTGTLDPDLILLLGDTVNNAKPGRYAALHGVFREHAPVEAPVLAVPGNHDMRRSNDSLDLYLAWIGPLEWRLDLGGWRILGLNNAAGFPSEASLALLEGPEPERGLVVVAHRPIEAELTPRPDLVLSGHVHAGRNFVDERGTRHIQFAKNCDRSSDTKPTDRPAVALLVLREDGFEWSEHLVEREWRLREEIRRVVGGSFYPVIVGAPVLFTLLIVFLAVLGTIALWKRS